MKLLLAIPLILLVGCNGENNTPTKPTKSPTNTYIDYHEQAKTNLDFNIELSYYSKNMKSETQSKIDKNAKKKNITTEEVKTKYMKFISTSTACMELHPISEIFSNTSIATITFNVIDLCSDHAGATQKVTMVNESGWKIDSIEITL
jgi:hypothetical protein